MIPKQCKRLAEVDFPIAKVSAHSAREKSIRHGHPSTLHLWWARRPLAACRSMLMALLLPDPCDPHCPPAFKDAARRILLDFPGRPARWEWELAGKPAPRSVGAPNPTKQDAGHGGPALRENVGHGGPALQKSADAALRHALLHEFIADFANWDNAASPAYLKAARALVKAAHGDEAPLVVDPFAGGGSIPLEALRIGCDAFASDLNPVACLINKVLLEDIPRHGPKLAEELRRVGAEIKKQAERELAEFYPPDPDGARPIAYLWARTVRCEQPNCGCEIPLLRSVWLCNKASRRRALRYDVVYPSRDRKEAAPDRNNHAGSERLTRTRDAWDGPAAYFLTWTCYGTWLHGDNRMSVDREHNIPGEPFVDVNARRAANERERLDQPPYELDAPRRRTVLDAIRQDCDFRGWLLHAAHVRSNHVHVIVSAPVQPERVLNDLKSYASRRLNEAGFDTEDRKRWTRHGSTRYLWKEADIGPAADYVLYGQGEPMEVHRAGGKDRSLAVAARTSDATADAPRVEFTIFEPKSEEDVQPGTVSRAKATCPACNRVLAPDRVRAQLHARRGGAADARLLAVVTTRPGENGRFYRLPTEADLAAVRRAADELRRRMAQSEPRPQPSEPRPQPSEPRPQGSAGGALPGGRGSDLSLVPDEPTPPGGGSGAGRAFSQRNYGMDVFADLFTPRQLLALTTLARLVRAVGAEPSPAARRQGEGSPSPADSRTSPAHAGASPAQLRTSPDHSRRSPFGPWTSPTSTGASPGGALASPDDPGNPESHRNSLPTQIMNGLGSTLALALTKLAELANSLCPWEPNAECPRHLYSRQAISAAWDFAEGVPTSESSGSYAVTVDNTANGAASIPESIRATDCVQADACCSPLADDSAHCFFTDPPYYDAVPYADLSDFFYVWLKRCLPAGRLASFAAPLAPKDDECIVDEVKGKDRAYFERTMGRAMAEGRRLLKGDGVGAVVFAHKTTEGWEALLGGMIAGGWVITGSWPITTEMATRLRAKESAALAASVHLVCRPRDDEAGIGDWGEIIRELPRRIGDWMERLSGEGIRGADLVFACIGPALELFSKYARVETPDGEEVGLAANDKARGEPARRGFLSYVWEFAGRTALNQVLGSAEARARNGAAGALEEDARLTALFLWTLQATESGRDEGTKARRHGAEDEDQEGDADDDGDDETGEDAGATKGKKKAGLTLIYDVARRFAQPLGIHLDVWEGRIIETSKGIVRLLPVRDRAKQLFGEEGASAVARKFDTANKPSPQMMLDFMAEQRAAVPEIRGRGRKKAGAAAGGKAGEASGESLRAKREATTLDRVHAAMLLQSSGASNALRALLEAEVDRGPDFLRLANALSALYPRDSEEKRLLDAMLLAVPR